ncbi:hypothetical protein M569_16459, partial [Genlisea aurea]
LGPIDENTKSDDIPILCVIQVSFEGEISRKSVMKSISAGHQPFGDQIPWKFCEQFNDTVFPSLSGARIVRIATHPSATRLGYGTAAIEILARYFEGKITPFSEMDTEEVPEKSEVNIIEAAEKAYLLEETIKPRTGKELAPLLVPLSDRKPEKLHYIGVSFGLTLELLRFWRKHNFAPFYISEIPSPVTGEHSCMILKPLSNDDIESTGSDQLGFFSSFYQDFRSRFTKLLARSFRSMDYKLAMSILDPKIEFNESQAASSSPEEFPNPISRKLLPSAMLQLEAYVNNRVDYHLTGFFVTDLACAYFWKMVPVTLSYTQASVLLCFGLQGKDISCIEKEMKELDRQQILSMYMKMMKKFYKYLS